MIYDCDEKGFPKSFDENERRKCSYNCIPIVY